MLNIKTLSTNILIAGFIAVVAAILIWNGNKPPAPSAYDRQQAGGSLIGSFAVNERDRQIAAYPKCLYQGSDYTVACPMGGNLHFLTWAGAGLVLLGFILRSSIKKA